MPCTKIAVAQTPITADPRKNGEVIRAQMRVAKEQGARLVQFPEGAASGYSKSEIRDWADVDWPVLRQELGATAKLAGELGIWVVLGGAHMLSPGTRPHNSLYVIDDHGRLHDRYDKRFLSNSEVNDWFTPGFRPVLFEVDGVRFGCALCIEISFPEVFRGYEEASADIVLLSSYSDVPDDRLLAQAHAHLNKLWVSLSLPANPRHAEVGSLVAGPNGKVLAEGPAGGPSITTLEIEPEDPRWEIELRRARPWRRKARLGEIYQDKRVSDERSDDVTSF